MMATPILGDPGGGLLPMSVPFGDFWIPAKPMPQPRPQGRIVKPRHGQEFIQMYYPDPKGKEHKTWREAIWRSAQMILPPEEIDVPVLLTVKFYINRPKNLMRKKDFDGPMPHAGQRDIDNFAKTVMDALNPVPGQRRGLWTDDGLVFHLEATKYYAAKGNPAGAYVLIETVDPESQVNHPTDGPLLMKEKPYTPACRCPENGNDKT